MAIYLLYSFEDSDFAQKLAEDLVERGIELARADRNTDERFSALHKAEKVIVVLSNKILTDVRVLSTLSACTEIGTEILAVRITTIDQTPKQLKGILPLDFSNPELYDEVLETLIEDINPSFLNQEPSPAYLPEDVQDVLDNLDFASLKQRRAVIDQLGHYRDEEDILLRTRAKDALSDLVFREKDGSLKRLASITLQSFDGEREHVIESQPPVPDVFVATIPTGEPIEIEDVPILQAIEPTKSEVGILHMPTTEVWETSMWLGLTHVVGLGSAVALIIFLGLTTVGLTALFIYVGLAWFNIQIRANGQFIWEMPGPMVGNGLLGLILAVIAVGLGAIFESLSLANIIGIVLIGIVNGMFMGWISSLRVTTL